MKRQEFLINLTLLVLIGALIFFIYESKDQPSTLDELDVAPVAATSNKADSLKPPKSGSAKDKTSDRNTSGTKKSSGKEGSPGLETSDGSTTDTLASDEDSETTGSDAATSPTVVAAAGRAGNFGQRNLFRAILTPTPTPTPPPPTPAPTPNITAALGSWRLLSVYEGKAMMEDVKLSEAGEAGAIWEMAEGDTKQVDVGNGIMKTATLKKIDNENPYNPEVVFGLEDTNNERKINLDTEPLTSGKK